MQQEVVIRIEDEDRYFVEGLRHCLRSYFSRQGINVLFNGTAAQGRLPDLVFASMPNHRQSHYCTTYSPAGSGKPQFFTIREKQPTKAVAHCAHQVAEMYRRLSCQAFYAMLDRVLVMPHNEVRYHPCAYCQQSYLSVREREVVRHLRSGLSQAQAAARMQLSVKTVHTYKRSIMSKMVLKRKHEFMHWLLAGNNLLK
ncbi:response regulator transcription factor [Serratia entomophila]|uniref:response regulator transcription factor n=1 Tax=Serratia entomophila TaxID=42906 RepID=UPI00217BF449|nr:LuxR C-terminal-related transcriptional regulator [Serratia entomophila]CAI0928461.1 two component system sensor kinase SsrB [Serratia entomophila]CAI1540652.1 two component system sensor kinase SsrB [Serratia entomophila]CAI1662483.1 two component system sensor kinase SsrB [Serratia entomophila]CAI1743936.1 two component system sensor kinase SsrB [Serratia entomophila]CAI1774392.1 two component system sensor kinase SsrB [Serratia entomophila]